MRPYCVREYRDQQFTYTVYDRTGAVMIRTGSRRAAGEYLKIAKQGITASLHYWLERWNYQIPRWVADQIPSRAERL